MIDSFENGQLVRVVFNGALATQTPLIAQMAIDRKVAASILSASTRSIGGKVYGNMLLGIPGDDAQTREAIDYLRQIPDIFAEEVKSNA